MDDTEPKSGGDAAAKLFSAAMPGTPLELAQRLLMEVADSLGLSGDPADEADDAAKVAAALQMVRAAAPRDALEAMLAAQMAAFHAAAMRTLRRAAKCADYPGIEALYTREAARLMQLFTRQSEALEKGRARAGAPKPEVSAAEDSAASETRPITVRARRRKAPRRTGRQSERPQRYRGAAAQRPPPQAQRNGAAIVTRPRPGHIRVAGRNRLQWAGRADCPTVPVAPAPR